MALHQVICAVRKRPEPEITEVVVPPWRSRGAMRRLEAEGWETVFVLRTIDIDPRRNHARPRSA